MEVLAALGLGAKAARARVLCTGLIGYVFHERIVRFGCFSFLSSSRTILSPQAKFGLFHFQRLASFGWSWKVLGLYGGSWKLLECFVKNMKTCVCVCVYICGSFSRRRGLAAFPGGLSPPDPPRPGTRGAAAPRTPRGPGGSAPWIKREATISKERPNHYLERLSSLSRGDSKCSCLEVFLAGS